MIKKISSNEVRLERHLRIRNHINGTQLRPRLVVFRSNSAIYAQIIDDVRQHTLVSASTKEAALKGSNIENAKKVGLLIGKKAIDAGITKVVFDRGGYIYTGKVKALADGAREAGLDF
ncbi:MAG: 50S ribosomal protein L18 [Acholeplasmatales bacterium]|jgi:large subunit ribosomal protein L18|nr:50S ribosomal protein L18 [Acholeplasmatales bacterium]